MVGVRDVLYRGADYRVFVPTFLFVSLFLTSRFYWWTGTDPRPFLEPLFTVVLNISLAWVTIFALFELWMVIRRIRDDGESGWGLADVGMRAVRTRIVILTCLTILLMAITTPATWAVLIVWSVGLSIYEIYHGIKRFRSWLNPTDGVRPADQSGG